MFQCQVVDLLRSGCIILLRNGPWTCPYLFYSMSCLRGADHGSFITWTTSIDRDECSQTPLTGQWPGDKPLGVCTVSKKNALISPLKNVWHHTASSVAALEPKWLGITDFKNCIFIEDVLYIVGVDFMVLRGAFYTSEYIKWVYACSICISEHYIRIHVHAPAMEAGVTTVLIVWLRAWPWEGSA
jgi:hypothetical protein